MIPNKIRSKSEISWKGKLTFQKRLALIVCVQLLCDECEQSILVQYNNPFENWLKEEKKEKKVFLMIIYSIKNMNDVGKQIN